MSLTALFSGSCSRTLTFDSTDTAVGTIELKIGLDRIRTRAATETETDAENRISTLDVAIYNNSSETNTPIIFRHYNTAALAALTKWASEGIVSIALTLQEHDALDGSAGSIYVAANTPIGLSSDTSIAALKQMVINVMPEAESQFVMEGHIYNLPLVLPDGVPFGNRAVALERLAAKVRCTIALTDDNLPAGTRWGTPTVALDNRVVWSRLVHDASYMPSDDDYTSDSASRNWIDAQSTATLYCFENTRQDEANCATTLLINVPLISAWGSTDNYYKITLGAGTLQRNNIYDLNVTVNRTGSSVIEQALSLEGGITIAPWEDYDSDGSVICDHLYVPKTHIQKYFNSLDIFYQASGTPQVKCYAIAADGTPGEEISDAVVQINHAAEPLQGHVTLSKTSPSAFTSPTPRYYVVFTVRTIVKGVVIEDYPTSYLDTDPSTGTKNPFVFITRQPTEQVKVGTVTETIEGVGYRTPFDEYTNQLVAAKFEVAPKTTQATMTFIEAERYCRNLQSETAKPWRVPTLAELRLIRRGTLLDADCRTALDMSGDYHICAQRTGSALSQSPTVDFPNAAGAYSDDVIITNTETAIIRCVR